VVGGERTIGKQREERTRDLRRKLMIAHWVAELYACGLSVVAIDVPRARELKCDESVHRRRRGRPERGYGRIGEDEEMRRGRRLERKKSLV
jgi:hypothetical protein